MTADDFNHIQEWVELFQEQYGEFPSLAQLSAFIDMLNM